MSTPVTGPGTYGAGEYHLVDDLTVHGVDALIFTGTALLDLNGKKVKDTAAGNKWTHGVRFEGSGSTLIDRLGTGRISGFRVGAKCAAASCAILGAALSHNRYIGAWLDADHCVVSGGVVSGIGGVTDEAYAIGIHVGAATGCAVQGVRFTNMYRQAGYTDGAVGEGLAVNFSAQSSNCLLRGCTCDNDTPQTNTIGVFCGSGGKHLVENNVFRNFHRGIAVANIAQSTARQNLIVIASPLVGSRGIDGDGAVTDRNVVVGYETSLHGNGSYSGDMIAPSALDRPSLFATLRGSIPPALAKLASKRRK